MFEPGEMDLRVAPDVREVTLGGGTLRHALKLRIVLDPAMPPGEIVLSSGESVLRLINVGKGDGAP